MSIFISVYFFLSVCPMVQVNQWNTLMLLVPALAGLMASAQPSKLYPGGYPRACGEKYMATLGNRPDLGSPPRARGKAIQIMPSGSIVRITPACAGKGGRLYRCIRRPRDHPRVRGEKGVISSWPSRWVGSSPRMQGKANDSVTLTEGTRITPACARKRSENRRKAYQSFYHSRVCEEKIEVRNANSLFEGSPPAHTGLMFIPASAARSCPAHTLFRRRFLRRPPGESALHL